ncbi:MAG: prepilin-type N-terminal cleavage/methylation domain-containing protein, partial [Burkholderiales bacterium]|nr:prepilin-type N-terminal cleavage/methylation domain-containing protein [Burkholderiales bacterium]
MLQRGFTLLEMMVVICII